MSQKHELLAGFGPDPCSKEHYLGEKFVKETLQMIAKGEGADNKSYSYYIVSENRGARICCEVRGVAVQAEETEQPRL